MRSLIKKISLAALVFVGAITLTNANGGDFCTFDNDCSDRTEVCLSNSCEKFMDPDFMKYYLDTPAQDLNHAFGETVSNMEDAFNSNFGGDFGGNFDFSPSFPFGNLQSLLLPRCTKDADCKKPGLQPNLRCSGGYCKLPMLALYEDKGEEAAFEYVRQLKERVNPFAHREEEILSLALLNGKCRDDRECVGGRVCKNQKCAFRHLSLSHVQTQSEEWAKFESELDDIFSDLASSIDAQLQSETIAPAQETAEPSSLASYATVKTCKTHADCDRGKFCIKQKCQLMKLASLLQTDAKN